MTFKFHDFSELTRICTNRAVSKQHHKSTRNHTSCSTAYARMIYSTSTKCSSDYAGIRRYVIVTSELLFKSESHTAAPQSHHTCKPNFVISHVRLTTRKVTVTETWVIPCPPPKKKYYLYIIFYDLKITELIISFWHTIYQ